MKYGNITSIQADQFAREQRRLWACAYKIDNQTLHAHLKQAPVEGVITPDRKFAVFGANGRLRSSGRVSFDARQYADTYAEAVELYNELVTKRKNALEQLADTVYDDYIPAPFISKRGGWHPVNEPPCEGVDVQITYVDPFQGKSYCNAFAYFQDGDWYWTGARKKVLGQITAWRSNDDPYQE